MNARLRRSGRYLLAALAMAGFGAVEARADPSTDCRNLALWFGSQPARLDMQSLAMLSTCVTEEIQARAASPGPASSSSPPSNDATSGGQSAPQTGGTSETWPTSPAWKDQRMESKPWDSWNK